MLTLEELASKADVAVVPATRGMRLLAYAIDTAIVIAAQLLTRLLALGTFPILTLPISMVQIVMLAHNGQTIGKWLVRIAIVDNVDHEPPGFVRAALVRALPQMLVSMFFPAWGLGYTIVDALPIFASDRRCIHDRLAGTMVIALAKQSEQPS
jgi:uncharacterized RDD family membrane protein YckC